MRRWGSSGSIPRRAPSSPRDSALHVRWYRIWTARTIVLGAFISLVGSLSSVAFLGGFLSHKHHLADEASLIVHGIAFAISVFTCSLIVLSVVSAFRDDDRTKLLIRVVTSYFSLMVIFASLYYAASFISDFQDAVHKYDSYRADEQTNAPLQAYRDQRAFGGIEHRFWTGVDWLEVNRPFYGGVPATTDTPSVAEMRTRATDLDVERVVRFVPEAQLPIFFDCLHFSVVTMTTVGYGDIVPRSAPVRAGADIEAICNTLLLIFGLGIIFGNRRGAAT